MTPLFFISPFHFFAPSSEEAVKQGSWEAGLLLYSVCWHRAILGTLQLSSDICIRLQWGSELFLPGESSHPTLGDPRTTSGPHMGRGERKTCHHHQSYALLRAAVLFHSMLSWGSWCYGDEDNAAKQSPQTPHCSALCLRSAEDAQPPRAEGQQLAVY